MTLLAQKFRVPLNRAALMCQIQHLVGLGYWYWHSGSVHVDKAIGLLDKFCTLYPIQASASTRATNRRKGVANVDLLWARSETDRDHLVWYLLATKGREYPGEASFRDPIYQRERMKDSRNIPVAWGQHYLLHQRLLADGADPNQRQNKRAARMRWTWSMTPKTLAGWREQVVQAAVQGDFQYQATFSHLIASPMFGGIRLDLRQLERWGHDAWRKNHSKREYRSPLPTPLPFMPRIRVYGELTLSVLAEQVRKDRDTACLAGAEEAIATATIHH